MKRFLLLSLILLASLFAINTFNVDAVVINVTLTPFPTNVDPSATVTGTVNLTNNAGSTIIFNMVSDSLTKGSDTIPAPIISPSSIQLTTGQTCSAVGAPACPTFTITVPAKQTGPYSGTIKATASNDPSNTNSSSYTLTINSKPILNLPSLTTDNKLILSSQPDKIKSKSFTIKNDGSVTLNPSVSINGTFTDNDEDKVTITLGTVSSILPGNSSDVSVTANIPDDLDLGTYSGTITVSDTANSITKTFTLEVKVEPEICEDGRVSNKKAINGPDEGNLKIDVKDPDDGDNFSPGEEIKVSVNVENDKDDELEVVVESILFNIDQDNQIISVESEIIDIDKDDDQNVDLTLKVPISDSDLDEGEDYRMYIKVSEDGNEDENCNYDSVNLDFERNTHDVAINKVLISPAILSCSETVNIAVDLQNIGRKDEDNVQIRLKETTLGLDQSSEIFGLKKFDRAGDSAIKTFNFAIPSSAKDGDYYVDTKVFFVNEVISSLTKLTVKNCQAVLTQPLLTLPQTSFTVNQGRVFTVPLTIKNPGTQTVTYSINVQADNNWADVSADQRVSVAPGEQTTLYAYLTPKPTLTTGTYSATINLKQDGNLVKTERVTASVSGVQQGVTGGSIYQPSITLQSLWRNLTGNTAFLIAGVVIVFALIIYALSALLRPR